MNPERRSPALEPGAASAACRRFFATTKTLMFNGYGDQVASMYAGMDLKKILLTAADAADASSKPARLRRSRSSRLALLIRGLLTGEPRRESRPRRSSCTTGRWALQFLLSRSPSRPLRRLTGWNVVIQYRRMLGLFAFFYAPLHFASYIVLDQVLRFGAMLADIAKRPFITVGFTAFLLHGAARAHVHERLDPAAGAEVADAAPAGLRQRRSAPAIHFIWKVKVVIGEPGLLRRYPGGAARLPPVLECRGRRRRQPAGHNALPSRQADAAGGRSTPGICQFTESPVA